jgi:hypothetical protein
MGNNEKQLTKMHRPIITPHSILASHLQVVKAGSVRRIAGADPDLSAKATESMNRGEAGGERRKNYLLTNIWRTKSLTN